MILAIGFPRNSSTDLPLEALGSRGWSTLENLLLLMGGPYDLL